MTGTSVVTQNASDFWESIAENLRAIIGGAEDKTGERSVVINSQSGVVVVRAMPNELRDVADYLRKTQNTVTRQVVLEAKIVEVELSDAYQAGINWAARAHAGQPASTSSDSRRRRGGFDGDLLAPPTRHGDRSARAIPINGYVADALGGAFTLAADFADFNAFIELLGAAGPHARAVQPARLDAAQPEGHHQGRHRRVLRHRRRRATRPPAKSTTTSRRRGADAVLLRRGARRDAADQRRRRRADAHPPDRERRDRPAERAVGAAARPIRCRWR